MSESVIKTQQSLSPVLGPLGWLYGRVMRVREKLYENGLMSGWEPPVPTISVGNIGWGGTGKTPVAGWLLGWAQENALNPVLLTRGYRADPGKYPYIVKPGALAEEAGDEPLMLARAHEKAHVVVDPERTRAGKMAVEHLNPDLFILDDGFQHMAVKRDLNLVLLRPEDLADGWNKVIPAGSWREPAEALERADAFMLKVSPEEFAALMPRIERRLGSFFKPVFSFSLKPTGLRSVVGSNTAKDFNARPYMLVSGVGDPRQVQVTARRYLGYPPHRHLIFKDHHPFTKSDVTDIVGTARDAGCQAILCTPKDAVKLCAMCTDDFWQFDLSIEFGPSPLGAANFQTWWNLRYKEAREKAARRRGK